MAPEWSVLGKAGAATARVALKRGQRVKAEPDALITMSDSIELSASMDSGLIGGYMRSALAGESLFSQVLTAQHGDGDVLFGAPEIGDVELVRLTHGHSLLLQKGAFLACDEHLDITMATQRSLGGALFSGTGLFVLRATGQGQLALSAHGSILTYSLAPGEVRAVDNGHLVGWSETMRMEMKLAGGSRGGGVFSSLYSSAASGEGLMCFFTGPGTLWLQTHKPPPPPVDEKGRPVARSGNAGSQGTGCCGFCVFLSIVMAILYGIFVYVPNNGGRWVQQYDGSYTLQWDAPKPPSPARQARLDARYQQQDPTYESPAMAARRRAKAQAYGDADHYEL